MALTCWERALVSFLFSLPLIATHCPRSSHRSQASRTEEHLGKCPLSLLFSCKIAPKLFPASISTISFLPVHPGSPFLRLCSGCLLGVSPSQLCQAVSCWSIGRRISKVEPRASCKGVQPWEALSDGIQPHPTGDPLLFPFTDSPLATLTESLFCARHRSECWRNRNEQDRRGPCPSGSSVPFICSCNKH